MTEVTDDNKTSTADKEKIHSAGEGAASYPADALFAAGNFYFPIRSSKTIILKWMRGLDLQNKTFKGYFSKHEPSAESRFTSAS
jgi:hypothetical protein